jgi:chromosome segregation ATPase
VDDLVAKRLEAVTQRLDALERRMGEAASSAQVSALSARLEATRSELIDHGRQVELRLATAVHGVLAAVQDLKTWHQDRDDVRARMQQLEARLADLEQRT